MACITSTFFLESLAFGFLLGTTGITLVQSSCTFPPAIRSVWVRGHDSKSLTFTDSEVSGLDISYSSITLDNFSCRMSSGNQYVIKSEEYTASFGDSLFYICWELVRVTDSAYILYELSDAESNYGNARGYAAAALDDASIQMRDVCHQSASTQLFTTLIKDGASASDVASSCPNSLIATFSYGECADTELDFCSDEKTAVLNYTKCATQVFNSAGGTLSCMGDATNASHTYLNLFNHDGGGGVTCFRFVNNGDGTISGDYYTGDCTTSVSDSLTLTKIASCPTPPPPTQASTSNGGNAVSANDDSSEDIGPIIAGAVVGSLAFIAAAAVITVVLLRKAKSSKVSASTSEIETPEPEKVDSELPDKLVNGTANGAANGAVVNGSAPELIVETPEANS